jgi:hypothetical protein
MMKKAEYTSETSFFQTELTRWSVKGKAIPSQALAGP